MDPSQLSVLFEDNHLLVVNKPAELPTMGASPGSPTLQAIAKQYIKEKYDKPGNVFLGTVSRLDAPVTGVVVMARTSKAAARLTNQFRKRTVKKSYWAIVVGRIQPESDECVNLVAHHERHRKVLVVDADDPGAKEARLRYVVKQRLIADDGGQRSWLEVTLLTGRKHQIRVQLAHRGFPILGDRKYGSRKEFGKGIALHARHLVIQHPVHKTEIEFTAPLPQSWDGIIDGSY